MKQKGRFFLKKTKKTTDINLDPEIKDQITWHHLPMCIYIYPINYNIHRITSLMSPPRVTHVLVPAGHVQTNRTHAYLLDTKSGVMASTAT